MSPSLDLPPKGGFSFDLCRRNAMLENKGLKPPTFLKTGTTIVGLVFQIFGLTRFCCAAEGNSAYVNVTILVELGVSGWEDLVRLYHTVDGVILGADTRATEGPIVADKNCEKIHYMAPNIYCCGAGTAADTEAVTDMVSSQLQLHRYHTGRESRVVTALTLLKKHLFNYQGHVSAALVLGGVDITGPHLHTIYPHGSTDTLPFATMGSGSLAAMSVFESKYKESLSVSKHIKAQTSVELFIRRDEGIKLVVEAICAGIFNDLGSGSNVDVCVITKGHKEYLRNHLLPNPRTFVNPKGFTFPKKTEVLLTKITPLKEKVEVIEGDAMEE
ncbi:Proteasome subunit beta type-7-B [Mucuna pruriens]|uniref:proteasome endopeptidase complex n=1 Tax=Mucuna pruriens TaxID=157652 RepID=A0A371F0C2_MUCPR|nr:Proteasome subunit beta type-7-B [Mucuna pruriens]